MRDTAIEHAPVIILIVQWLFMLQFHQSWRLTYLIIVRSEVQPIAVIVEEAITSSVNVTNSK